MVWSSWLLQNFGRGDFVKEALKNSQKTEALKSPYCIFAFSVKVRISSLKLIEYIRIEMIECYTGNTWGLHVPRVYERAGTQILDLHDESGSISPFKKICQHSSLIGLWVSPKKSSACIILNLGMFHTSTISLLLVYTPSPRLALFSEKKNPTRAAKRWEINAFVTCQTVLLLFLTNNKRRPSVLDSCIRWTRIQMQCTLIKIKIKHVGTL
jgi:hypothetical protein